MTDPEQGTPGRGVLLYFYTEDAQAVFERARAMGADCLDEPHREPERPLHRVHPPRPRRLPHLRLPAAPARGMSINSWIVGAVREGTNTPYRTTDD